MSYWVRFNMISSFMNVVSFGFVHSIDFVLRALLHLGRLCVFEYPGSKNGRGLRKAILRNCLSSQVEQELGLHSALPAKFHL
jgi:hypothetical protein